MAGTEADVAHAPRTAKLVRAIGWLDAFWIASGVPALLVFSVGFIAILNGPVSVAVWVVSVLIGLGMAFVYAEMAGIFPEKSGGPPVFGAQAWRRYAKSVAPLSIWGYWFAWSPVISIGGLLMGLYIKAQWFASQNWSLDFGPHWATGKTPLLHINFAFVVGAAIILSLLWLNHFGIKESAIVQLVLGLASLIPLGLLIIVPVFKGELNFSNLHPFVTPNGRWGTWDTFALIAGGLFVAGWSAYAFETAVVYTAEFRNPKRDTPRAIFSSGALCLFFYGLGPLVLLAVVGKKAIELDPSTALVPLAKDVFGLGGQFLIALLLVALLLSINTAILGSSRTLHQAGKDGWTVRFMQWTTPKGVPMRAMGFDVTVNLLLMLLGNPIYILAASTIGYMVSNVLELTAGNLLRRDAPQANRPYRAPNVLMRLGLVWAAVNLILLFVGAPAWGWGATALGWFIVATGLVTYAYRQWSDRRQLVPVAGGSTSIAPAEEDPLGPFVKWGNLTPMVLYLAGTGIVFTLATWYHWAWAYVLGLALTAIWLAGFAAVRQGSRWYVW